MMLLNKADDAKTMPRATKPAKRRLKLGCLYLFCYLFGHPGHLRLRHGIQITNHATTQSSIALHSECQLTHKSKHITKMILPFLDLLILLLLSSTRLSTAYPSPAGLAYLPKGQCTYAGQVVCASTSTFAICDASLMGVIQPLAVGDTRCGDFGGGSAAATTPAAGPPPASSTRTTPANSQEGTLGFMQTIESMIATATTPPASSSTPKKPGNQTTSTAVQPVTTPAPHFASGTGLEVIPVTPLPTAVATAAAPPREGCNPGKSTCSGD
ncbi:uncharacterized protein Z520_04260 [Fonsecaea multimorphosa CBS 102226]|uniref:Uncharacterized protein n=1 Tax=Fonsecaea multimorphosa CBS 102226 TaxID=1442371 RepID=A0A0D2IRI0_9EURO|nr:uncharacterized protein Z520_04260 [Fonsecaea multimorphosa CBS 102226]KIX99626.1 hypothetical protein Z520_04260 [Fonsecaea multimorphosa CBS 102226]OAL26679.1 hypothetical protein AYO22_04032 [Fonsecaea multimorphosa]